MNYTVDKNRIVIINTEDFCPMHILECGQVFRFKKVDDKYIVYSKDKCAKIVPNYGENGQIISYDIITDDIPYFINYFDLDTDYGAIKNTVLNLWLMPLAKERVLEFSIKTNLKPQFRL